MSNKYKQLLGVAGIGAGILKVSALIFNLNSAIISSVLGIVFLLLVIVMLIVNVVDRPALAPSAYNIISPVLLLLYLIMVVFSIGTERLRDLCFTVFFTFEFVNFSARLDW